MFLFNQHVLPLPRCPCPQRRLVCRSGRRTSAAESSSRCPAALLPPPLGHSTALPMPAAAPAVQQWQRSPALRVCPVSPSCRLPRPLNRCHTPALLPALQGLRPGCTADDLKAYFRRWACGHRLSFSCAFLSMHAPARKRRCLPLRAACACMKCPACACAIALCGWRPPGSPASSTAHKHSRHPFCAGLAP